MQQALRHVQPIFPCRSRGAKPSDGGVGPVTSRNPSGNTRVQGIALRSATHRCFPVASLPGNGFRRAAGVVAGAGGPDGERRWTVARASTDDDAEPDSEKEDRNFQSLMETTDESLMESEITKGQAFRAFAEFCLLLGGTGLACYLTKESFGPFVMFLETCNEVLGFGSFAIALFAFDRAGIIDWILRQLDRKMHMFAQFLKVSAWKVNIVSCFMRLLGVLARAVVLLAAVDAAVEAIIPDSMTVVVPERLAGIFGEAGSIIDGNQIEEVINAFTHKVAHAMLLISMGMQLLALKHPPPSPFLSPEDGLLARYFLAVQGKLIGREYIGFAGVANLIDRVLDVVIFLFVGTRVLGVFGVEVKAVLAVAGVGALAVSFAARPLLQNLISGLLIFITNPFTVGDKITCKGVQGIIQRIGWAHTQILLDDGLIYMAPNDMLASAALMNLSRINMEDPVQQPLLLSPCVPGTENLEEAVKALHEVLKNHSQVDASEFTDVWFMGTVDNGSAVKLILCFNFDTSVHTDMIRPQRVSHILTDAYTAAQKCGFGAVHRSLQAAS